MDKTFEKFLCSDIDLSSIGIERREDNASYFCTPKGASIFGWAGVDGIHYCFVRGFGGVVFAVSPMNSAPDFVHPLARDFADFLRLILACGDAAALEQAWMWDEAQFAAFLQENPPTREQKAVLEEIAEIGPCSGKYYPEATNSVIAIIGGADGPTTITVGVPDQKSIHVACSALHFEPVDEDIEWRIEFSVDEPLKETFQLV